MKYLLSLSGGLDSTTLAAYLLNKGNEVEAISFYYGSKHNNLENTAAKVIAAYYKINLTLIDISQAMIGIKSALLNSGGPIPEGHYESESMKQTVVPARNMIFSSILAGIAETRKIDKIALGVHAGDHHIYPDCRPEFILNMGWAIRSGTGDMVKGIYAPFIHISKSKIVGIGMKLGVPYHYTRTCYSSDDLACGKCGSCVERKEAFQINGYKDPLQYQGGK